PRWRSKTGTAKGLGAHDGLIALCTGPSHDRVTPQAFWEKGQRCAIRSLSSRKISRSENTTASSYSEPSANGSTRRLSPWSIARRAGNPPPVSAANRTATSPALVAVEAQLRIAILAPNQTSSRYAVPDPWRVLVCCKKHTDGGQRLLTVMNAPRNSQFSRVTQAGRRCPAM